MLVANGLSAAVIYVDEAAAGANNGTSWANAYTDLQDALATAVAGDEIWIAQGVYKPSVQYDLDGMGADPREVTFQIPNGVMLYGGFAGGEVSLDARDWETNETILSGDIDNNDFNNGNGIAESPALHVGNNAYHVILTESVNSDTGLDGLIITAGRAETGVLGFNPNRTGGGWHDVDTGPGNISSPTITHCRFIGNFAAAEGGAMRIGSFDLGTYQPAISHSEFISNEAVRTGGALYLLGDAATIDSSTFSSNLTSSFDPMMNTSPGAGGAVALVGSDANFHHCMFIGNSATGNPTGAFEGGGGGAVYINQGSYTTNQFGLAHSLFLNCGFYGNTVGGNGAAWGGAMRTYSDGGALRVDITGCVFSGNGASDDGGALANYARVITPPDFLTPVADINVTNSTFHGNMAGERGGAIFNVGYTYEMSQVMDVDIENTITYENNAMTSDPEVHNNASGVTTVAHSLIDGSGGSGGSWDNDIGTDGGNNLDINPKFLSAANAFGMDGIPGTTDDGLRLIGLGTASAAVDGGNNAATGIVGVAKDFAGNNRIRGSKIDMGAYETYSFILPEILYFEIIDWNFEIGPGCLRCPPTWSLLLDPYTQEMSKSEPGTRFTWVKKSDFVDYGKYAVMEGIVADVKNPKAQFEVYIKLENKQSWKEWSSEGRTYRVQTKEAARAAKRYHTRWSFWELSPESYLKGRGEIEGVLRLRPGSMHTGFQQGKGGNALDADLGLSGEFKYEGKVRAYGKESRISGKGSLHIDTKEVKR